MCVTFVSTRKGQGKISSINLLASLSGIYTWSYIHSSYIHGVITPINGTPICGDCLFSTMVNNHQLTIWENRFCLVPGILNPSL